MALTITAANSIFTIAIPGLFSTPQQLQGYAADAAFATEAIQGVEIVMGVDAHMSAGWVPVEKRQTVSIMPDSPSCDLFDTLYSNQQLIQEIYFMTGEVALPAILKRFVMTRGVMSNYTPVPDVAKTLRARTFGLTWEQILPVPY